MLCNKMREGVRKALSRLNTPYRFFRCNDCGIVRTVDDIESGKPCWKCESRYFRNCRKLLWWEELWFIPLIFFNKIKPDVEGAQ